MTGMIFFSSEKNKKINRAPEKLVHLSHERTQHYGPGFTGAVLNFFFSGPKPYSHLDGGIGAHKLF